MRVLTSKITEPLPETRAFYPALDGLRALAFLAVFLGHYRLLISSTPLLNWGWVGVDIFFVLSGFLITGILFDSLPRKDFFRAFYVRRSLRIFPLFYGFWICLLVLTPVLHIAWNRYNFTYMAYIGNFFYPYAYTHPWAHPALILFNPHVPNSRFFNVVRGFNVFNIGPLWSLCVEEQFYIVWPAIVWLVRSRVALLRFCLAAIVVVPIARIFYFHACPGMLEHGALYIYSWSRVDTLLFGAALALWRRGAMPKAATVRRMAWVAVIVAPVLVFVCMEVFGPFAVEPALTPVLGTVGYSLIAFFASGLLLLALDPTTFLFRCLRVRPLTGLGRISYGLYFFHALPMVYILAQGERMASRHLDLAIFVGTFVCSVALAWLSFRYYETPFLKLKERWAPSRPPS